MKTTKDLRIAKYMGKLESMLETFSEGTYEYLAPARRQLGHVAIVLERTTIAPAIFRQQDPEPLTTEVGDESYLRALASKFSFTERNKGLQILRKLQLGGRLPQNRMQLRDQDRIGEYLDINTFCYGDSLTHKRRVLSVKRAFLFSDAISLQPALKSMDTTFHNRANESGTLWDESAKKNSNNIFDRVVIAPGTTFLQVISTQGATTPPEVLDHLLLCLGQAGAYGGGTSNIGVNVATRVVGMFGGYFEKSLVSPWELRRRLRTVELDDNNNNNNKKIVDAADLDADGLDKAVKDLFIEAGYLDSVSSSEVANMQSDLEKALVNEEKDLIAQYNKTKEAVAKYFEAWFGAPERENASTDGGSGKNSSASAAPDASSGDPLP